MFAHRVTLFTLRGIRVQIDASWLLLAAFTMVPAYPLDGGRALRAVLWLHKRDIVQASRIAAAVGSIFAFLLMALGIVSLLAGYLIPPAGGAGEQELSRR